MDETTTRSRGPRGKAADIDAETANADTINADATTPREVQMYRAVHELRTGPDPDDKIDGGTIITDALATEHDLDDDQLDALVDTGAVELVDVLVR